MPPLPFPIDFVQLGLGGLAFIFFLGFLIQKIGKGKLHKRIADLEGQLQQFKAALQSVEFRIKQFDVLWFPTVAFSPVSKEVTQVNPGVPHCQACVVALSMASGRGEWACPKCGSKFPESLVDVMIADSVTEQALKLFEERHKGYKLPSKNKKTAGRF